MINNRIATNYKMRDLTYDDVAQSITAIVNGKIGNYLIYFPSYKYLEEVHKRFILKNPDLKVIYQTRGMSENERDIYLQNFSKNNKEMLVGFSVMGGVFGEGIDLIGDRLSGAVIVGVGLPQICLERNIIRDYFNETKKVGFEYAYMYPGMIKVMQAVGRVIRSETDRGVALLIDKRFSYHDYIDLFPQNWKPLKYYKNFETIIKQIKKFWEN